MKQIESQTFRLCLTTDS